MKYLIYGLMAVLCPYTSQSQNIKLQGRILNNEGLPLPAASVLAKNHNITTITNKHGYFIFNQVIPKDSLIISCIGYLSQGIVTEGNSNITVRLIRVYSQLDETVVMAYGSNSKRYNTGNIIKVSGDAIAQQPVLNIMAALHGRIPGLVVTQTSGVNGAMVTLAIRGRSSLDVNLSQNDPLIIIDGVPFESGNQPINKITSAARTPTEIDRENPGGISPLNNINTQDIASIEVLKDADATAIYGSRGANGVIIISTKKSSGGKEKISVQVTEGFSRVGPAAFRLFNTREYIAMRREAFVNDGVTPDKNNAPDVTVWDTTRYTNLKKLLIGNTARSQDYQASLTAGNAQTRLLLSMGYRRQTNVFSKELPYQRFSTHINIQHKPLHGNWDLQLSVIYGADKNKLIKTDLSNFLQLPPNIKLTKEDGSINWQEGGVTFTAAEITNPLAEFLGEYEATSNNLSANMLFSASLIKNVRFRLNTGYNILNNDEISIRPKAYYAPEKTTLANSSFSNSANKNWIVEPQLEYNYIFRKVKLQCLLGSSFQQKKAASNIIEGSGYSSDLLLHSIGSASTLSASNSKSIYLYNAIFARINVNVQGKYIVNLSGRRDGSSRFGPERRFSNFAAAGAAWIFTEEPFLKKLLPFLSFGKLRASYGVTGNDQIGDYSYLDLWNTNYYPFQGIKGLLPGKLFNPYLEWEKTNKAEAALELGFLKDKIVFTAAYYQHRSSNQLLNYRLPNQTGFNSVLQNFPGLVQNSGWELAINADIINHKKWNWKINANISIPRNILVSFPGLATSSYRGFYVEGKSLSVIRRIKYIGVDPTTGLYSFEDYDKDGKITSTGDQQILGNKDPRYYGGISNALQYGKVSLEIFFDFMSQTGQNYLVTQKSNPAGNMKNQHIMALDRWQKPGDNRSIQRYTASRSNSAYAAASSMETSNAIYSDASYIRLKNIALAYQFSMTSLMKNKDAFLRAYLQAQNLLTISSYKGADPESRSFNQTPPLQTLVMGFQLNF
jgi:TonB-linked SusC/RagA family outer membrane protein